MQRRGCFLFLCFSFLCRFYLSDKFRSLYTKKEMSPNKKEKMGEA